MFTSYETPCAWDLGAMLPELSDAALLIPQESG